MAVPAVPEPFSSISNSMTAERAPAMEAQRDSEELTFVCSPISVVGLKEKFMTGTTSAPARVSNVPSTASALQAS